MPAVGSFAYDIAPAREAFAIWANSDRGPRPVETGRTFSSAQPQPRLINPQPVTRVLGHRA